MGWDETALRSLCGAARQGDRAALCALSQSAWPTLRRWALLELGDPSLAEDAAQEALVRMIRFLDTWSVDRPFGPWLHAIVRHAARDIASRRGLVREPQEEPSAQEDARRGHLHALSAQGAHGTAAYEGQERALDLRRTAERAMAAFARLSPRQRQVLDLCDRQDLSPSEAAALLEIAPGTVRALLHQGRRALRALVLSETGDEVLELLREGTHDV